MVRPSFLSQLLVLLLYAQTGFGIGSKRQVHRKGGRPPLPWRLILDGIFFVLRTGCQWKAIPKAFGSGSSLHRYFQSLVRRRLFRKLWRMALEEYDDLKGID